MSSEQVIRAIPRQTRCNLSADEEIRITLDGLRGEGIHPNQYYTWSKEFLGAGKRRLKGDTERPATSRARKMNSPNRWPPSCCWRTACRKKRCPAVTGLKSMGDTIRSATSEKLEILQLVWEANLSVRYAVRQIGISRSTYYDWLENRRPLARRIWNRLDAAQQTEVLATARELVTLVTEKGAFFVSESTVLRLLKAHNLLVRQPYILLKAAEKKLTSTTRIHQMWQTDFTYFHVQHWGWY